MKRFSLPSRFSANIGVVCTAFLLTAASVSADDWPQWMGPQRDNIWRESGLLEKFPEGGPKVLWRTTAAGGYSGPAVANGSVFLTDYKSSDNVQVANFDRKSVTGMERIFCLDEKTGKEKWKHEYPVTYSISYPAGPRCTPVVNEGHVYTLGAEGMLLCLNADSGDIVWKKDLKSVYNTKAALWGYAAHPLIDGDKLITLAGGKGSHVVALNKKTGQEIWRSGTAPEQGYTPPTIIEAAGIRQLIILRPDAVKSLDPTNGTELWSVPYEATSGSIIMSPIHFGEYLYVAGYSSRSVLLKLKSDAPGAEVVWRDKRKEAISPVNVQPIMIDDVLFGLDQSGMLRALQLPDGKKLWETSKPVSKRKVGSGTAFLVRNDKRCFLFTENGELIIAAINKTGYSEIDRAKVIEPTGAAFGRSVVWSMPAFANKHAYIRNDKEIICVDLSTAP